EILGAQVVRSGFIHVKYPRRCSSDSHSHRARTNQKDQARQVLPPVVESPQRSGPTPVQSHVRSRCSLCLRAQFAPQGTALVLSTASQHGALTVVFVFRAKHAHPARSAGQIVNEDTLTAALLPATAPNPFRSALQGKSTLVHGPA